MTDQPDDELALPGELSYDPVPIMGPGSHVRVQVQLLGWILECGACAEHAHVPIYGRDGVPDPYQAFTDPIGTFFSSHRQPRIAWADVVVNGMMRRAQVELRPAPPSEE